MRKYPICLWLWAIRGFCSPSVLIARARIKRGRKNGKTAGQTLAYSGVSRGGGGEGGGGGGSGCSNTPLSVHFINNYYSLQFNSQRTTRCMTLLNYIAPAPSEKTITGAASSRYAFEVDRTSEQSAGLRFLIRTYNIIRIYVYLIIILLHASFCLCLLAFMVSFFMHVFLFSFYCLYLMLFLSFLCPAPWGLFL